MKICILGGTGDMGSGLAIRWALKHEILIGSRSTERAEETAERLKGLAVGFYQDQLQGSFTGMTNEEAVKQAEIIVVCFPAKATVEAVTALKPYMREGQIIVSTVVPMKRRNKLFYFSSLGAGEEKSASETVQEIVAPIPVVTGLQTIPAAYLNNIDAILNLDVFVAGDDELAVSVVSKLIRDIPNLRPLKVGPLINSKFIESLTPLLLNAAMLNGLHDPSIRIVPWIPRNL
ncbi:MAG: NADPH-dependent F420 reductase [Candidatus Bathyarchaeota archaeon]